MKPLTPSTLVYGFTAAGDPQVSANGSHIAYTLSKTDAATKKADTQVWVCDVSGANKRRLTWSGERNASPRWSPDGRSLAFTSDRAGTPGLFVLPMEGGEAREVTRYHSAINDIAWSPDGTHIVFVASVDPANPEGEPLKPGAPAPVRVTSRIDYKQDVFGYLGDVRGQLFVVDVASGERKQLTSEPYTKNSPRWSPDSRRICAKVSTNNGMMSHLLILDADGSNAVTEGGPDGNVSTWEWSPDGSKIAYTGDTALTWQTDFFLYDVAAGNSRRVTTDLQCLPDGGFTPFIPPSMPAWLDERNVLFHAVHAGASGLYVIDLETGEVEQVEGERSLCSGMSTDKARRYVAQSMGSLSQIGEITVFDRKEGVRTTVTDYSEAVFGEAPPANWERFDIRRGEFVIEAWLLHPPGFDDTKKYPLIVDIHGGPNGHYGYGFNAIQQVLATNDILVVFCNPRGSSSYGRDFTSQVTGDWGGEDYLDIMAVVDEAVRRPYVDAERTGIYGYSYGGFMTARTIAQNHRFRAAVCGAPCFDLESMFGTSDISHVFGKQHWGGKPHEAREKYALHSPSQFAHNTRTPTLIIQGEADERCPVGQSEQMFVTLKTNGCETEFVRYPGQSHLFMRLGPPEYREDALTRILGWFKERLGEPV